jgi:hypothetical protein
MKSIITSFFDSLKDSAKIERACVKERERERERKGVGDRGGRERGETEEERERGEREREILKGEIPIMVVCMLDEVSS